MIKKGNFLS